MKNIIAILIFVISFFPAAYAADTLIIVRGQDFAPYHYRDDSKVEKGFIIEIINNVTRQMGIKVRYQQYPWSRCINMMKQGTADAMMNLFKTPERTSFMVFTDNILAYETNTFFYPADKKLSFHGDIKSLTSYKLGTIRNYSYGKEFDAIAFPKKFPLETESQLINALIKKRCDIIIGNKLVISRYLKDKQLDRQIRALSPDVSKDPLYIGFSKVKDHEKLADSFSRHLKAFKASPEYRNIIQAYTSTH